MQERPKDSTIKLTPTAFSGYDPTATVGMGKKQKAATGFEPVNNGFAN